MGYLVTALKGFCMGASDIVPGVSGGTIALIFGIYERFVANVYAGAKVLFSIAKFDFAGAISGFKKIEWGFIIPLGVGLLTAVVLLSGVIESQLENNPEEIAGLFFGLVVASIVVGVSLLKHDKQTNAVLAVIALAAGAFFFWGLGFVSDPVSDPSLWFFLGSGALAVCAMILPGISGSFILLMLGMYIAVLDALHDRDFLALGVFIVGMTIGLALFSSVLQRALKAQHDLILAVLIGLMIGSLRVLWPWPNGVGIISDVESENVSGTGLEWPSEGLLIPTVLAVVAFAVVVGISSFAASTDEP